MSVDYFRLIPSDPRYVPSAQAQLKARETLARLVSQLRMHEASVHSASNWPEVTVEVYETTQFIDQGENFEWVRCPFCREDLRGWWGKAMDTAYQSLFEDLSVTLPCCGKQTSLNDLHYRMPAGFARFVLEVENPGIDRLSEDEIELIETIVDCKIKQIWAYY